MQVSLSALNALLRLTFRDAREGAHAILSLGIPTNAMWISVALVAVLSALMAGVSQVLVGGPNPPIAAPLPGVVALTIAGVILATGVALHYAGRAFGGTGRLEDAILLMVWLQVVLLVIQFFQTIISVVAPSFASIVFLAAFGYSIWLMISFIDVLHGFGSRARSAVLLLLTLVGMSVGLGLILSLLGISVAGGPT